MSRIADTSALCAVFVGTDKHHAEAQRAFLLDEPTIVPSEILAETLALLHYRLGFDAARRAGEALRGAAHIRIAPATPSLVEAAWDAFVEAGGKLSMPDSYVIAWAKTDGSTALTYDKAIRRALAR